VTDFSLHPGTDQQHALIYSATAQSLRSSPYYRDLDDQLYTTVMNQLVAQFIHSPKWMITVAHPDGYDTEIAGFIAHATTDLGKPVIGVACVQIRLSQEGTRPPATRTRPEL